MSGNGATGSIGSIGSIGNSDNDGYVEVLRDRIAASVAVKQRLLADEEALATLTAAAGALVATLRRGGTVFFCGNGGSSTDAQHLSAELLGRFYRDRPALPSVCLSDNVAAMTAIANDYSYPEVFSRQLSGLAREGDTVVGLSTSGNSANVVLALQVGAEMGLTTVAFTGSAGGKLAAGAQYVFRAPTDDTPRVQECHLLAGHTLCEIVENELHPAA